MAGNRTLTIIKPDAFGSGKAGQIIAHLEKAGFKVLASRVMRLTEPQASAFYARTMAGRIRGEIVRVGTAAGS